MISDKIDSVSKTLRGLGGQVHPEVYELLRQACAELEDAKASARKLEAATLAITISAVNITIQ